MKNTASRILALIVALTVLLMPAAMAAEQNMAVLSVGNFEVTMDGQTISLPVTLQLGGGADIENARGMALASLLVGDQVAGSVYGAMENDQIKAFIDGMNYGLYVPLADAMAMFEEETGMSMADLTGSVSPEMQAALTDMMNAAAALEKAEAEIDPAALQEAMGVVLTEAGTEEIVIFEETVSADKSTFTVAPQTMQDMMDALCSVSPAFADYWAAYSKYLDETVAMTGEEIDTTEALQMVTVAAEGTLYTAGTDSYIDLVMSMAVEEESFEFPFSIAVRETDALTAVEFYSEMTIDSETLSMAVVTDETNDETGSSFSTSVLMGVTDDESGESEMEMTFFMGGSDTAEGLSLSMALDVNDGYDPVSAAFDYVGTHAVSEGGVTSWDGVLALEVVYEEMPVALTMDTNLTLSSLPEGELIALGEGSINLLEADDAAMEQFATDAQMPMMQLLGTLMQDPTIASLLGSMMG